MDPALIAVQLAPLVLLQAEPVSTCGVTDPASMTEDQAACVSERTAELLANGDDPLALPPLQNLYAAPFDAPPACSSPVFYPEARWPVGENGQPLEIAEPVRVQVRFTWQEDGRTGDIHAELHPAAHLASDDAARFESAAADALALWQRPPACIDAHQGAVETVFTFALED